MTDTEDNTSVVPPADPAPVAGPPAPPTTGHWVPYDPGRTLGIVGFALSFIFPINIAGLILSIVGMVKSRRAGVSNGFALAGIIISAVGILISAVVITLIATTLIGAAVTCAQLGTGVHVVGNATYTCTPTSFYVRYGS